MSAFTDAMAVLEVALDGELLATAEGVPARIRRAGFVTIH